MFFSKLWTICDIYSLKRSLELFCQTFQNKVVCEKLLPELFNVYLCVSCILKALMALRKTWGKWNTVDKLLKYSYFVITVLLPNWCQVHFFQKIQNMIDLKSQPSCSAQKIFSSSVFAFPRPLTLWSVLLLIHTLHAIPLLSYFKGKISVIIKVGNNFGWQRSQ